MKAVFVKGILSVLLLVLAILPGAFYITYANTDSTLLSLIVAFFAAVLWKLIVGGGLRKRRKYVDLLLAEDFPKSEDDPLSDPQGMFKKDWLKGSGYTNEVDQPVCVKVIDKGIALLYLCRASKAPFIIPWERLSQINLIKGEFDNGQQILARLFIPGVGMKVLIPWEDHFNKYVPGNLSMNKGEGVGS